MQQPSITQTRSRPTRLCSGSEGGSARSMESREMTYPLCRRCLVRKKIASYRLECRTEYMRLYGARMRCRQLPELGRKGGIDSELWQRLIGRTLHDLPQVCCLCCLCCLCCGRLRALRRAAFGSWTEDWRLRRAGRCGATSLAQPPKATAMAV